MYQKRKPVKRKDKLPATKLTADVPYEITLKSLGYILLNPKDVDRYSTVTYVDEVVLLCVLKDVDVIFDHNDCEYYIDGINVSTSIDKLISYGYLDSETLKPNKKILRRTYITHKFVENHKFYTEDKTRVHMNYWYIEELEKLRSKWKARTIIQTLNKGMSALEPYTKSFTFTTLVNVIRHKPRFYTEKEVGKDFEHNLVILEQITSVLLKEIQKLLD